MKSYTICHVIVCALAMVFAGCMSSSQTPSPSSVHACNKGKEIFGAHSVDGGDAAANKLFATGLEKAYPWFRLSAEQNNPEGERWLAMMYDYALYYSRHEGVTVDLGCPLSTYAQEAEKWYKRAADHGDQQAARDLAAFRRTGCAVVSVAELPSGLKLF